MLRSAPGPRAEFWRRARRLALEQLEDGRLLSFTGTCPPPDREPVACEHGLSAPVLEVAGLLTDSQGGANQTDAYSAPLLADWNSDGRLDLLVSEKSAAGVGRILGVANQGTTAEPVNASDAAKVYFQICFLRKPFQFPSSCKRLTV